MWCVPSGAGTSLTSLLKAPSIPTVGRTMPNRNYYNAPSPIHGTGVFSARRIPRGELIGVYTGVTTKRDGTYVLWVERGDGKTVGRRGRSGLRFLNHSGKPNAEFDGDRLYARRVIPQDEEITFHYGEEWEDVP